MSNDLDNSSILDNRYLRTAVRSYAIIFGFFCIYIIYELSWAWKSVWKFLMCSPEPTIFDFSWCVKLVVDDLPFIGQVIFDSSLTVPFIIGVAILAITLGWIWLDEND